MEGARVTYVSHPPGPLSLRAFLGCVWRADMNCDSPRRVAYSPVLTVCTLTCHQLFRPVLGDAVAPAVPALALLLPALFKARLRAISHAFVCSAAAAADACNWSPSSPPCFAGFRKPDKQVLHEFFSTSLDVDIEDVSINVKGWNWGDAQFDGTAMSFVVEGGTSFELPLNAVSNVSAQKSDVILEFHQADLDVADHEQSVESMRFLVVPHPDDQVYCPSPPLPKIPVRVCVIGNLNAAATPSTVHPVS